jgi:ABC-type phosphate transport system substrate-binding protein
MYLSLWIINVNGRNEEFATNSSNLEQALTLFKHYFMKKHPDKGFNVESVKRVTGIEFLSETTSDC